MYRQHENKTKMKHGDHDAERSDITPERVSKRCCTGMRLSKGRQSKYEVSKARKNTIRTKCEPTVDTEEKKRRMIKNRIKEVVEGIPIIQK